MILIISSVFAPEPVASASITYDLALALSEDWEVKVLTPKPSRPFGFCFKKEAVENRKFEQIILNSYTCPEFKFFGRIRESYSFGRYAVNYIDKNWQKIECIYIDSWPLLSQYMIVKSSKKYKIPSVIHVDDIYPESLLNKLYLFKRLFFRLLLPLDKYIQKNTSKIITISPRMKSFLIGTRGLEHKLVNLVYNWQNENSFISYEKNKDGKSKIKTDFTFMFLGSLNNTSSVDIIINSFKKSGTENSRLIIAGTGPTKNSLLSLAANYEDMKIEFWDAPLAKVPEIQEHADILLLNLKKGAARFALPSKLIAYMFSAKPIIACVDEDSDTADAIIKCNCGWIVPAENIDALAETMIAVTNIPRTELQKKGTDGYNYAMETFSKRSNLPKLIKIMEETIKTKT